MSTHFSLRLANSDRPKALVNVSKKVSKKAVTRNTIKRRVKAIMRDLIKELKPATYTISAKAHSEEVRGKELEAELRGLLKL